MNNIVFETIDKDYKLPQRATKHSVGYDFFAIEDIIIQPNERIVVSTGVKCKFPNDMWLGIYGRSSFVQKGLINPLGVGVVDSDYYQTGNAIGVALWNITNEPIEIKADTAIGQGVFHHAIKADDEIKTLRTGGFGSTDKQDGYEKFTIDGETYIGRRVSILVLNKIFKGWVIDYLQENVNLFISDKPYKSFHDGTPLVEKSKALEGRCWFVTEEDLVYDE